MTFELGFYQKNAQNLALTRELGLRLRTINAPLTSQHLTRSAWSLGLPDNIIIPPVQVPTLIAIGGGKGGIGKTLISANMASQIAELNYRVLVIDLDIGCPNLHTQFGVSIPDRTLSDFLIHGRRSFQEIIHETKVPRLSFIPAGKPEDFQNANERKPFYLANLWNAILHAKEDHGIDIVILDLGAGTDQHTLSFFLGAHLGILTVLPEPTSIENAYTFLKSSLWMLMDHVGKRTGQYAQACELKTALTYSDKTAAGMQSTYPQKLKKMEKIYPHLIENITAAISGRYLGILMNQTRTQKDLDIGKSMEIITQKYFGVPSFYLGSLNYDEAVWKSLRNRHLIQQDFPHSIFMKNLSQISLNALSRLASKEDASL